MEAWQAEGMWWLPADPDKKLFGTLTCNDEGELRLSLLGSFAEGGFFGAMRSRIEGSHTDQVATILGISARENTNNEITLRHCFVLNKSWSGGELGNPLIASERALVALLREHQKEVAPLITDKDGCGVDAFINYALNTLRYTMSRQHPRGPFAAEGAELHWLTERLAFLIKISLLKELEFASDQVAAILKRNPQFRHIAESIQPTTSWTS